MRSKAAAGKPAAAGPAAGEEWLRSREAAYQGAAAADGDAIGGAEGLAEVTQLDNAGRRDDDVLGLPRSIAGQRAGRVRCRCGEQQACVCGSAHMRHRACSLDRAREINCQRQNRRAEYARAEEERARAVATGFSPRCLRVVPSAGTFMSRCMIPCPCRKATALHSGRTICSTRKRGAGATSANVLALHADQQHVHTFIHTWPP